MSSEERRHLSLTDPRLMRAIAHPVRMALLEAMEQAEARTLTATQASELLGESPANCAFHLRTLAKYGFVEEAGGGQGRERPWRLAYRTLEIASQRRVYLTAAEAKQLAGDIHALWERYRDRDDDPSLRPPGSLRFEVLAFGYPVEEPPGPDRG